MFLKLETSVEWNEKNPVCLYVVFPETTFEQSLVHLERENEGMLGVLFYRISLLLQFFNLRCHIIFAVRRSEVQ